MTDQEKKIIEIYKNTVEFYNIIFADGDTSYASARMNGMEEMAQSFGYVLYAHHKSGVVGLEYDYISIAKDGNVLSEIAI